MDPQEFVGRVLKKGDVIDVVIEPCEVERRGCLSVTVRKGTCLSFSCGTRSGVLYGSLSVLMLKLNSTLLGSSPRRCNGNAIL